MMQTGKMANNASSSTKKTPRAAAAAALSGMIALNVCPAEAFQPSFLIPSSTMMHRSPSFSSPLAPAAVTMDCAPWDMECYGVHPFGGMGGGLQRRRRMQQRRPGAMIFSPEDLFQGPAAQSHQEFTISDPTVSQDTDDLYTLTFDLPADVNHDGLEVSVSGRLLTVKARVTREVDDGPSARRAGWVTRSSRMDSVSRSFVLPEGLSASSAATSFLSEGKVEVKFAKDQAVSGAEATATALSTVDSNVPVNKAAATPGPSAERPASSSSTSPSAATPATPAASSTAEAPASGTEHPASLPGSPFDVFDQEFHEFAKAMWGEEVAEKAAAAKEAWAEREAQFAERVEAAKEARAKREAEFEARVKAAKEARAKRVMAMRRATMASDLSKAEDGSSYVIRIALPEGVTRDNVKLTVNANSSLRITVSASAAEGGRSVYKDVFLPKDALIADISAKFKAEQQSETESNNKGDVEKAGAGEGAATASYVGGADAVSGLEVTVGRAVPPQPKNIDIM